MIRVICVHTGRVSPRRARYFSLLRQRKVPKRKASRIRRPCATLRARCVARDRREAQKLADLWLVRFNLGRAYLEAGYYAEALSEFELCAKRRGEGYAAFLNDVPTARYVAALPYWTARAQEGLGLADQARSGYDAFLASQAAASPDPLVKDARTRVAAGR